MTCHDEIGLCDVDNVQIGDTITDHVYLGDIMMKLTLDWLRYEEVEQKVMDLVINEFVAWIVSVKQP